MKRSLVLACLTLVTGPELLRAQPATTEPVSSATRVERQQAHQQVVGSAVAFLRTRQLQDGSFSPEAGLGVTSLVATALMRNGVAAEDPVVRQSLEFLQAGVQPSGGIHVPDSMYRNYETCLAVMCFTEANSDGRYLGLLTDADRFLKSIQWEAGEGIETADPAFGGAGYGSHKRPDLSNTAFMIEALRALGNDENSEAIQQALVFVSRCQNLVNEHNDTPFANRINDGGFYYTAAAGGTSQAGADANGGLRSYASMTYAGLKSMIFAGVSQDDPRVQAALSWIGKHYDLRSNPGMGDSGLFYYYHTFAKALDAAGIDRFEDATGTAHDWRAELNRELAERQQPNGSWTNSNARWLEANPDLVTGYALLALSYTDPANEEARPTPVNRQRTQPNRE